jgi:ATP-dependent Lhr-like helicase
LRKEVEPVDATALARFLPSWQGVDRWGAGSGSGAGIDRLRDVLVPLQGLALPVEVWEREVLPRRCGAYSYSWMDQLCAAGEVVWIGAGALGRSGRVALYFREDLPLLGGPSGSARGGEGGGESEFASPVHLALRERLGRGAAFWTDLLVDVAKEISAAELQSGLWDLVWAGEVTNDAFAPLRAQRLAVAAGAGRPGSPAAAADRSGSLAAASLPSAAPRRVVGRRRGPFSARNRAASAHVQGRWSLTAPLLGFGAEAGSGSGFSGDVGSAAAAGHDPAARRRARAELLLERYGVLTREQVLAEGVPGGFSAIYAELTQLEVLGTARRGYFVEGLGGAQFAAPGAVERLRERGSGAADEAVVLSAVDPAQPYGAVLPWPKREGMKSPARVAGAQVVLVGGEPVLYLDRGGKSLTTLIGPDDPRYADGPGRAGRMPLALAALAAHIHAGRGPVRKLGLEKVDGEPAVSSPLGPDLRAHGFQEGPRKLTLSA